MFFKSMEIYGFKSFPDKTILHFDKRMTAVVGSNGNGKSNISDAPVSYTHLTLPTTPYV